MKFQDSVDMLTEVANENYASLRKLAELNIATMDKLVAKQVEMMTMCLQAGSRQYEAAQGVKRVDELLGKQAEMARECGEKMMQKNSELVDLLASSRDEYQAWAEENATHANEWLSRAAETARKAA